MLNFTPPPRQQVLYGIRVQAERLQNLVEDLQAGSMTAMGEILGLASQILARSKMYDWPQVTIWASALEERLARLSVTNEFSPNDLKWLELHVARLEEVLEGPAGAEFLAAEQARMSSFADSSEESAEFSVDERLHGMGENSASIELDYTLEIDESAEATESIVEEYPRENKSTAPPPIPEEARQKKPKSPGDTDDELEGRAMLGKVDLQRRRRRQLTRTHTEIQGPNQYIVVSVSSDPEVHIWLGKVLPERRFELLAARGAAEAEILCREHQPDLVLAAWGSENELAQQALARIRENPLTRYVRVALVVEQEDLAGHLAAIRLNAMGVIPKSAKPKKVYSRVILCMLAPGDLPNEEVGETSIHELSDLLLRELRGELVGISTVVGDVLVPVGSSLGQVLRDTSRRLRDGVKDALGCGLGSRPEPSETIDEEASAELFFGKRALIMEADRLRRAELAHVLGDMGLEVLPTMPDLTKALEGGLAWAPDVFIGGAPVEDSEYCVEILKRDIALSSMSSVMVRWPDTGRQWPDPQADTELLRPWLRQRIAESFAPVGELKRQLEHNGDVTGRVESCGMLAILQHVMTYRQRALLEIGEGTDQFKAMIKDGQILDVVWIEIDGNATLHFDAFARMLAVSRGRFFVKSISDQLPELALPGSLQELLTAACHWWRPLGLTIDQSLMEIQPLELDNRRSAELKRQTGKIFRKVVAALEEGYTPCEIITENNVEAGVVAHVLRELVRRFVVKELPSPRVSEI